MPWGPRPLVPDANGSSSLQLAHNSNGDTFLTFGFDSAASPNLAYVLKSSLDLVTWNPVYRYQNWKHDRFTYRKSVQHQEQHCRSEGFLSVRIRTSAVADGYFLSPSMMASGMETFPTKMIKA